jgi:predicted hydrocarbon binding protein
LSKYGALTGVRDTTFRSLPSQIRVKIGIQALARIFSQISDQLTTVEEEETHFRYIVHRCPECWGRSLTSEPICSFGAGLLEEGLNTFSGGTDFRVNETRCIAKGDTVCEYSIDKSPVLE